MSNAMPAQKQQLLELLAARSMAALDPQEQDQLDSLMHQFPDQDLDEFDRLAAMLDCHWSMTDFAPMPVNVRDRVVATAQEWTSTAVPHEEQVRATTAARPSAPSESRLRFPVWASAGGWLVAAACLVLAPLLWGPSEPAQPIAPSAQYAQLASKSSVSRVAWSDLENAGVTGDVVWDNQTQTGVMRLKGLAANNPDSMQYQLWIFDRTRDAWEFPAVDGGVFDVSDAGAEVYIPIDAKLEVFDPYLFAITTEPPGGVVKHVDRDDFRIVLTATAS